MFCPFCSYKTTKKKENFFFCAKCKRHIYVNPRPTNALITQKKGHILFVKRKYPPQKGFWDLPGGFVDLGESFEESLRREVKEEIGVSKITKLKYFHSYAGHYYFEGKRYNTVCVIFTGNIEEQKITIGDDAAGIGWLSKRAMPYEQIAFASLKRAIKEYISHTK